MAKNSSNNRPKGLGRGFESLIPTDLLDDSFNSNSEFDPTINKDNEVSKSTTLPITKLLANPTQPRQAFDSESLEDLTNSIKLHGILQPLIVTPKGDQYEIVAGERRYRAAKQAGLSDVPVIIRLLSDQNQLEISLIENIQRRDLNSVETAVAYVKLRDQFNLTNEQIATRVNKSASSVNNTMRLLKLPKPVVQLIAEGKLSEGQARPLIGQDADLVTKLAGRIAHENWSARRVEDYISKLKKPVTPQLNDIPTVLDSSKDALMIGKRLNTKVNIKNNANGSGSIVIKFNNTDEYNRIKNLF